MSCEGGLLDRLLCPHYHELEENFVKRVIIPLGLYCTVLPHAPVPEFGAGWAGKYPRNDKKLIRFQEQPQ